MRARLVTLVSGLCLVLAFGVFFGKVFSGQVYYPGDTARIYLPQRALLQDSLRSGKLPWWSSVLGAGYPLVAEGEVGALYPLNWPLYAFLPIELGLTFSIVLHYAISAIGMVLLARGLALSSGAALFSALSWALGGFAIAHLSHISILSTVAWLPWMLWLTHRLGRARDTALANACGLAVVTALQFLTGHPQMALLNILATGALALALLVAPRRRGRLKPLAVWIVALAAGALLAAPQLLPSYQLASLSQRAGGLEGEFFTSYSFHPLLISTLVSPFALGNPYPQGSVELMAYLGLLPLVLASVAVWRARRPSARFFLALAASGLVMAFGRWNPLYHYLGRVPLFNLFRVPARYLCWTSLGLALLGGYGWDALLAARPGTTSRLRWLGWVGYGLVLATGATVAVVCSRDADSLVAAWRWLPLLMAAASFAVLASAGRVRPPAWAAMAIALLLLDLYAYGAVLDKTYNATHPLDQVRAEPLSVSVLRDDPDLYRIYTKEEILPALAPLRESLYPNIAATYGIASANLYMPLVPAAYGDYLADLDAQRLSLLNVRYYLVPQLLPVDEASELYDVSNPFADLPYHETVDIRATHLSGLIVESYLSHSADLPDGTLAATVYLQTDQGDEISLPIRAGLESAEWAYERSDVQRVVAHARAPLASTWPARSGYPPEDHTGHTYLATYLLEAPATVTAFRIEPERRDAFVRLVRIRLIDADGNEQLLSSLVGLGDHSIIYRSEDVLIYRNEDAFPRAFVLPASAVIRTVAGISLPESLRVADVQPVEVLAYEPSRVVLRCNAAQDAYVILGDLDYPGWCATVDGAEAVIVPVDGVFRAVALTPGAHEVAFAFRPFRIPIGQ